MTDVDDFIDVDKFNEEVEKIKKEKVFEKPIKEYGADAYRKIIDKILDQIHAPPTIKEGVLNGMMEMLKATKIFELISPDEFERVINSMIRPDKKANNPDFLTGMMNFNSPFDVSGGGMPFEMKQPPQAMMKMLGLGGPESETLKLSGKLGNSQISVEITDKFTLQMAKDILHEVSKKYADNS